MSLRTFILLLVLAFSLSSCVVQKIDVGQYNEQEGKTTVYKKGIDFYLFWETIAIQRVDKGIDQKNYQKVMKRTFFDYVLFYGTIGVMSPYHSQVIVKVQPEE